MKKVIVLFISVLTLSTFTVQADNERPITIDKLPQKAQQFIKQHFSDAAVAYVIKERDFLKTKYEVVFTNRSKIEFHENGEWKEVDCKHAKVPEVIVPEAIATFVTTHYPTVSIVQIDRDSRDYEINLSNGLELTFDLKFNLIDIDD